MTAMVDSPSLAHLDSILHRPCSCGRRSAFLCDYRTGGYGVSCDAQVCPVCVFEVKPGRHYCASHKAKHQRSQQCA